MFRSLFDNLSDFLSSAVSGITESLSNLAGNFFEDDTGDVFEGEQLSDEFDAEFDSKEDEFESENSDNEFEFEDEFMSDFEDKISEVSDIASDLEDISSIIEDALDSNLHPRDLVGFLYDLGNVDTEEIVDNYEEALIEKLNLSTSNSDANYTEREIYGTWSDLQDYLESFNGGYPDDDILDIVLTDEGFRLYVAISSV